MMYLYHISEEPVYWLARDFFITNYKLTKDEMVKTVLKIYPHLNEEELGYSWDVCLVGKYDPITKE